METLESSRVCRLCGQHSGICINIFDKNENHVKKINAVLPILVHEMDLLPKQMCHRCSYKLEEFHKFYADCLKTDMDLKSQLSWMRKRDVKEDVRVPMVQIENVKIKSEPPDYDIYELDPIVENVNYISSMSPMTFSMNNVRNNNVNPCEQHYQCQSTFANCSHFNCNYCKNTNPHTNQIELPMNRSNEVKRGLTNNKRDPTTAATTISRRGMLNTFKHSSNVNDNSKELRDAKQSLSKVKDSLNRGKILKNDGRVADVKIKMEKIDAVQTRSLRPRRKSVDYIGRKRKKDDNNVIANPAKRSATSVDIKEKNFSRRATDSLLNKIVNIVRKESVREACGRSLRPRKLTVDYIGRKRRKDFGAKSDMKNKSDVQDVFKRKEKSFVDSRRGLNFATGKCSSNIKPRKFGIKVKEEVISDVESPDIEQENDTRYNIELVGNHVRNLTSLFERDSKPLIKVESEDIDDVYAHRDKRVNVCSLVSEAVKSSKYKSMLRNVAAKKVSENKSSQKYLKMENLSVKNSRVKKSESDRSSIRNLNKRLSQLRTTRSAIDSNLRNEMRESVNGIRVPTSLKIADNIKHFCEKCCTSFINRELYMLHVCYFA